MPEVETVPSVYDFRRERMEPMDFAVSVIGEAYALRNLYGTVVAGFDAETNSALHFERKGFVLDAAHSIENARHEVAKYWGVLNDTSSSPTFDETVEVLDQLEQEGVGGGIPGFLHKDLVLIKDRLETIASRIR